MLRANTVIVLTSVMEVKWNKKLELPDEAKFRLIVKVFVVDPSARKESTLSCSSMWMAMCSHGKPHILSMKPHLATRLSVRDCNHAMFSGTSRRQKFLSRL